MSAFELWSSDLSPKYRVPPPKTFPANFSSWPINLPSMNVYATKEVTCSSTVLGTKKLASIKKKMYSWFRSTMLTILCWADDANRLTKGSSNSSWIQWLDIFRKSVKDRNVSLLLHRWFKPSRMTWVSLMMSGCLSQMLSMILNGRVYPKYSLAAFWIPLLAYPEIWPILSKNQNTNSKF